MSTRYPLTSPYVRAVAQVDTGPFLAIPRVLFHHPRFQTRAGKPHRVAIEIFAALISWYKPVWEESLERGGTQLVAYQRFPGQMLRINYKAWAQWLYGDEEKTRPIKRAVAFLKERGLIDFELRPVQDAAGRMIGNVPYIAPCPDAVQEIFDVQHFAARPPADLFEPDASDAAEPAPETEQEAQVEPEPAPEAAAEAEEEPSRQKVRDGNPSPSHQKVRDGAFLAPTVTPKSGHRRAKKWLPSRQKWRDLKKELRGKKNPFEKRLNPTHPPLEGDGGVGEGGETNRDWSVFLRKIGMPAQNREKIAQALAAGELEPKDVLAALAYAYAGRRDGTVRHPVRFAAALLARGDVAPVEFHESDIWADVLPDEIWALLPPSADLHLPNSRAVEAVEPDFPTPEPPSPTPSTTPSTEATLWSVILRQLRHEIPREAFDTWLQGTRAVSWDGETLKVSVRDIETRDWLQARLPGLVEPKIRLLLHAPQARVEFVVEESP